MKEIIARINGFQRVGHRPVIEIERELIRCKGCKYSKCIEPNDDWWECQHDKRVNHSDGYCNWAERKDNETD